MDQALLVMWIIQMIVLYFVIKWSINNSKLTEEIRDLKRKLEGYIEKETETD